MKQGQPALALGGFDQWSSVPTAAAPRRREHFLRKAAPRQASPISFGSVVILIHAVKSEMNEPRQATERQ